MGEDCLVLRIKITSIDVLDQVLDCFLAYGPTTTSIIQSTPVPPRAPPAGNGNGANRKA